MTATLSREAILALGPTTDLRTLGQALGVSEPTIREQIRRGQVDAMGIRVHRVGRQYRVVTADLRRALGLEPGNGTPSTSDG